MPSGVDMVARSNMFMSSLIHFMVCSCLELCSPRGMMCVMRKHYLVDEKALFGGMELAYEETTTHKEYE